MITGYLLFFAAFAGDFLVNAQDLSVLTSWQGATLTVSHSQRVETAQACLSSLPVDADSVSIDGIGYWQVANALSAMANLDYFAGSDRYQQVVTETLGSAFSKYPNFDRYGYNDDATWWATAAYYGYRAYSDKNLLNFAVATWQHVSNYVITKQAIAYGSPYKNFAIQGTCGGGSMLGGVFWRPVANDASVNSITTGLYMTLSAFLGEATGNSTYTAASLSSAFWIPDTNMNSNYLALDTIHAQNCRTSPWLFTYNTGKFLEGLSVLNTLVTNATLEKLMLNMTAAATKTTVWQGSDGIITEGGSITRDNDDVGFKSVLIRGLAEVRSRNRKNCALVKLIRSYTNVQFNALLNLASNSSSGTAWYSPEWTGPPPTSLLPWGQLAASDVLTSVVAEVGQTSRSNEHVSCGK